MIAFFDQLTGEVQRYVTCPENEIIYNLGMGEDYITVPEVLHGPARVVNGVIELIPVTPTYEELRRAAYPPIGDQLDALWHAMDAGVLPVVPAFYNPLKAVKEAIPKT